MAEKLTQITTQYHTFEDNQVLTKDQLNGFINYFDDQDRMSRVFLSGVGIVCGFGLSIDSGKSVITISQGAGVTTDGDLIKLRANIPDSTLKTIDLAQVQYAHFKVFEDSFAGYRFFNRQVMIDGIQKTVSLKLWEILPESGENTNPLNTLDDIDKKVVVLYLESFAKEGDLCTSIDCDNQGVEQVARLRVLLVSETDAAYLAGLDSIYAKHNFTDKYDKLPEIAVRRVILNSINSGSYDNLKYNYYQALVNEEKLLANLIDGITKIVTDYSGVLKLNLSKSALPTVTNNLKNILNFSAYKVPFDIQYRYDCIKDLVDTYNEIKCLLLSLHEECCPDINAFPKHLLLGAVSEIQSSIKHFRHGFYKSPILNCGNSKIQVCKNLVTRFLEIAERFKPSVGITRITPSNKLMELTYRSIPFYYDVDAGLLRSWNYFKTEKNRQDTNLCYHVDKLAKSPRIQNPLNYNIDKFDFYRIEGHQGKDYTLVLKEIDKLKTTYGLAFDVKALSVNINSENLNIDNYLCEFEDLNVLLHAWTAEQECVLAEVAGFFSGFSTAVPGANVKEPQLNLKKGVESASVNVGRTLSANRNLFINPKDEKQYIEADPKTGRSTYKSSEVIFDNLTTDKDALGSVMKVAFEETKGGSKNDIVAKTKILLGDKINTEEWKNQPEVKELVIDQSVELMAVAHILSQKMPKDLSYVNVAQVDTYKLTMSELCEQVKKMKARYQTVDLSAGLKSFIGTFVNQLSIVCCSGKKLQILLEEINKRKESILLRLQLSKFVEKNPGLEHLAGVQPGGTFILVYLNKVKPTAQKEIATKENMLADELLAADEKFGIKRRLAAEEMILSSKAREDIISRGNPLEVEIENQKTDRLIEVENTAAREKLEVIGRFFRETELPNNTVVADFSLPYMCCSDCAPINFIIQKPPVSLRIDRDEYCLGKDTEPLIFEVSPDDGTIKSDPEVEGLTIEATKLTLDAEVFPDEMLGKPIKFTVNDQVTPVQLTVYRAVQFDFEVPESPTSDPVITFIPTGDLKGASFLWSFGDDNLSTERNPTHTYNLPVNEENKVTVSLTVTASNGVCQTTVEHEIQFAAEKAGIELENKEYCENDEKQYPFKVIPEGAEVKIEGKGVVETDNGFVFSPAMAGPGKIEFLLDGEKSGIEVEVFATPVSAFERSQDGNLLILTNNSQNATSFVWIINGEENKRDNMEPFKIELSANSPKNWKVRLVAIGAKVCENGESEQSFETSTEKPKIDLELKDYCEKDEKQYPFIITPEGAEVKIEGKGVVSDESGKQSFTPVNASLGEISFTLNGEPTELKVTVHRSPHAEFTPAQVGNQLVLTNKSVGADSYTWIINGESVAPNSGVSHTVQLTPNSPTIWVLQLRAVSKNCGEDVTKETRMVTKFNEQPTVNSCRDETTAVIRADAKRIVKLQNPDSDWIMQVWTQTSNLYGGTRQFNKGVINDIDNYLTGKNNPRLTNDFLEVLQQTQNRIVEINRVEFKEDYDRLVYMFGLQLQLFYNVLACQSEAVIKESESIISPLLGQIIELLQGLQKNKVAMAGDLKRFMETYPAKVEDIALLTEHLKFITAKKLI